MYIPTNHRNKQAATAKPNNHHLQWKSRVTSKHPKKRRSETIRRLFSESRKVCVVNIRGNNVTSWHTSRPDSFLLAYGSVMGKFPNQQIFTGENMLALVGMWRYIHRKNSDFSSTRLTRHKHRNVISLGITRKNAIVYHGEGADSIDELNADACVNGWAIELEWFDYLGDIAEMIIFKVHLIRTKIRIQNFILKDGI